MEKTKLVVCMKDEEYKKRFVECVLKHYKEIFEIHVVHHMQELMLNDRKDFSVIITEYEKEIDLEKVKESVIFILMEKKHEEDTSQKNVFYTEKYQEVYKIIKEIEQALEENIHVKQSNMRTTDISQIGVYSLSKETMQVAYTALLAEILGENHRVLVMDIQPFSGLAMEIEAKDNLGMEDLILVATTQNYTETRVMASIGHEQKWDFIYPVKNVSCLAEASGELYEKVLDLLQEKKSYEQVIINFGSVCSGIMDFMETCQKIYILTDSKEERTWREMDFIKELRLHGKEKLLQNIRWVEIPVGLVKEKSWRQQVRNWLWNEMGDFVRQQFWMENKDGTSMREN